MSGEQVATGLYWDPDTWQLARAAYVADLDHDPDCPVGFLWWLHRTIELHVARGASGRVALGVAPQTVRSVGRGFNRHHPLKVSTRAALEQALLDDRVERGRVLSRSAWVHEAVTVAVARSRERLGRNLDLVAGRLPNRPVRSPAG